MNEISSSPNSFAFLDGLEQWAAWAELQLAERKASEASKN
jgi:hypothetical protein